MRKDLDLLKKSIDVHVHVGPSVFPRLMDSIEAAEAAKAAGMRGLVLKHHHISTMDRSYLAGKVVPDIEVYGGITLNYAAGGINPFAVDSAIKLGAKFVWMPTVDAHNHLVHFGELGKYGSKLDYKKPPLYENAEGISIHKNDGAFDPNIGIILESIAEADVALATSHLSINESKVLVEEALKRGVKKIVVTHIGFVTAALSIPDQKWMAKRGVLLELCYSSLSPAWRCISIEKVVEAINEVGAEHYILSSDLGQVHNPPPPEGFRIYISLLLENGIGPDELRIMTKENPERILGLNELS